MVRLLTFALVLLSGSTALGQTRPNLSGTWVMDRERSESAVQSEPIGPLSLAIVQSADDLVLTVSSGDKVATLTYRFDGQPTAIPNGTATSHWEGDALVTDLFRNINGQTVTTRETRRLNAGGDELLVERVVVVQHGYTLRGSQNYAAVKDVFVKAK